MLLLISLHKFQPNLALYRFNLLPATCFFRSGEVEQEEATTRNCKLHYEMFLILLNLFFPASASRKPHHMCVCVSQEKVQDFSKVSHSPPPVLPLLEANLFASLIPQSWDRNAAAAD